MLDIMLNFTKSQLQPEQSLPYIGCVVDKWTPGSGEPSWWTRSKASKPHWESSCSPNIASQTNPSGCQLMWHFSFTWCPMSVCMRPLQWVLCGQWNKRNQSLSQCITVIGSCRNCLQWCLHGLHLTRGNLNEVPQPNFIVTEQCMFHWVRDRRDFQILTVLWLRLPQESQNCIDTLRSWGWLSHFGSFLRKDASRSYGHSMWTTWQLSNTSANKAAQDVCKEALTFLHWAVANIWKHPLRIKHLFQQAK